MILALINKGYGTYGFEGTALNASDFLVISKYASEENNEPIEKETNVVSFDSLNGYIIGNASARTGNVTFDFTSEKLFSVTRMLHNSGTIPTFPAEGKVINGEYKVSVDNFIWLCLTKKTTGRIVEITIGQV